MLGILRKCLCAVFLAAFPALPAVAQDAFPITFEDYAPLEYMVQGEARGTHVAIIREAFRRMGITPVFSVKPWKRGLYELEHGMIPALASGYRTPERERFALYPRHYLSPEINAVFLRKDSTIKADSLDDLKGRTVGVVSSYSYGEDFDSHQGMVKESVSSNALLVGKLVDGRVDAIAGNVHNIEAIAWQLRVEGLIRPAFQLSSEPLYLFFSKARKDEVLPIMQRFDEAMDAMEADGTLQKLRSQ